MDFLRKNKRFSFKIDGVDAWTTDYNATVTENGNRITTKYEFANGLIVTNEAVKYENSGVYRWVNTFENVSDEPTGIISELWDCDVELPISHEADRKWVAYFPDVKTATKIYAPAGSVWSAKEFYCNIDEIFENVRTNHICAGETKEFRTSGGRSSEARAPFSDIYKGDEGYIAAIGWTGQWLADIRRTNDSIILRTKIEDTHFRILPREKFRTSSVALLPYRNGRDKAHNAWRRFVKDELCPLGKGERDEFAPLCTGIWGGLPSREVIERVGKFREYGLPFEYLWIDAGWYGIDTEPSPNEFEGDWPKHTGDWRVSPKIHPNGLKDVSEAAHKAGLKFLLWFEPERVIKTTPVALAHPEWFFRDFGQPNDNFLLNLGNEEAWTYCYETLSNAIRELGIDCYRQDFNISPLGFWRNADEDDRRGISEIKHINGMYRLWDSLLAEFPRLLIDNCASGGRRIDIETLGRSVPLWRSDAQCPANYDVNSVQNHNLAYNAWAPFTGTGSGRIYDEYRVRSAYAAALTLNYAYSETENFCDSDEKISFIRKYANEFLKVRPYFSEDFYPLTEITENEDVWCAAQFHRPSVGDGIVQVFRRENAPYETARFYLKEIDETKNYVFTDFDGGEVTVSGKELVENGFCVTINEKRKAKIFGYKTV